MAATKMEAGVPGLLVPAGTPQHTRILPLPLWIAFAVVIVTGVVLYATRESRLEAYLTDGVDSCEASVAQDQQKDSLTDPYGLVSIKSHNEAVAQYFSACETRPELAHRIFLRTLEHGSSSGKLIALHSAFFLAVRGVLTTDDFHTLLGFLAAGSPPEVRAKALRTLSDLTVCTQTASAEKYEAIPAGLMPAAGAAAFKIKTQETTLPDGRSVLGIRWSHPDLALGWLKAMTADGTGAWDPSAQRFITR